MRPRKLQATIHELRKLCGRRGIRVVLRKRKRSSHQDLVFIDVETEEECRVTIVAGREISSGVLRQIVMYVGSRLLLEGSNEVLRHLAVRIKEVLDLLLGNGA